MFMCLLSLSATWFLFYFILLLLSCVSVVAVVSLFFSVSVTLCVVTASKSIVSVPSCLSKLFYLFNAVISVSVVAVGCCCHLCCCVSVSIISVSISLINSLFSSVSVLKAPPCRWAEASFNISSHIDLVIIV